MNTVPQEQLREAYLKLPQTIKDALFSVDHAKTIKVIGEQNHLHKEQTEQLATETGLVMMGFTPPSKFIGKLQEALRLPLPNAQAVAQEINEKIFRPIKEELKQVYNLSTTGPIKPAQKEVAPPPNLPVASPERHLSTAVSATQMPRTEGFVPLQKKPVTAKPTPSVQRTENPFRTMKQDALKAMAENPVHPAPFNHSTDETMTDKATMLKKIETNGPIPKMPGGSILESKLGGSTNIPREKIGPKKDGDPYREEI